MQSVLLVPFPQLAPVAEPWLERSVGARPSHGIPPHVTLLFPFPPPDAAVIAATRDALAGLEVFDVRFHDLRRFDQTSVLYLAPDPDEPFVRATEALAARFPEWPPYVGAFTTVVPHLTVAWGDALDEAQKALSPLLPLHGRAREAMLLTEVEEHRWEPQAQFPFGGR